MNELNSFYSYLTARKTLVILPIGDNAELSERSIKVRNYNAMASRNYEALKAKEEKERNLF
jgi:hypothetical protein